MSEVLMTTIHLDLNVDEANLVLEALGQLPFVRVYALIGRIQELARKQIAANGAAGSIGANGASPRSEVGPSHE
jgi:hypothetical protein